MLLAKFVFHPCQISHCFMYGSTSMSCICHNTRTDSVTPHPLAMPPLLLRDLIMTCSIKAVQNLFVCRMV